LAEAEAALAHGANLVLTPHILQRGRDQDRERALLRSGSFNAGFLAVAPSVAARAFVAWWCERVRTGSTHDPLEGTYGDQKWLDLAPSICDGVAVLRHPGYNFAYWNAHERKLICHGGVWSAAGRPLRFVHYSQWNLPEEDCEQYLAGYFPAEHHTFAGLFAEYQQKVREEGRSFEDPAPDGADERRAPTRDPVPALIRSAYARHAPAVDGEMSEVLAHAVSVLGAPSTARADLPDLPLTILCDEIWQLHADLRFRFDVDRASGRLAYLRWLVEAGAEQLAIPAAFLGTARSAVERERIRVLEAADEAPDEMAALSPPIADPGHPELPASADTVAALIAARDAERDRIRLQQNDIRLLVSSNKGLRREVQSLRVRRWRDEETIQGLEKELAQTRDAHEAATRHGRELADEVALLRSPPPPLSPPQTRTGWLRRRPRSIPAAPGRRQILAGDGPFFERGFRLGEAAAITGATVRRIKTAPSGNLVFGPYVNLLPGTYGVTIEARLYQRLPVLSNFTVEIARDGAQQVVGLRKFHLHPFAGWRSFDFVFTVSDGEDSPDFEVRIWAHKGMPLEIGRIDLCELTAAGNDGQAAHPLAQDAGNG
jgi:hypothetical protein